ncbi:MAG: FAD-binding oxidoreductase [Ignavibacteria bacterium]|nr:FAD-binding oxidoreductase [Ignavibacteria bacterium]
MKHAHIVGFGIAGALLARELLLEGYQVTVQDAADDHSSSRVAAGMITPITGKRLKPTWRGPELAAIARQVYNDVSRQVGRDIWHDWMLRRIFREPQMQLWFQERTSRGEFDHLDVRSIQPGMHDGTTYPNGGFEHAGVATVDLAAFIEHMKSHVEFTSSIPADAKHIIWCTGYRALHHELWNWLPIEPSKGEILDVEIKDLDIDVILTNGTWILPVLESGVRVNGRFRIGATNDWDDHDPSPTAKGREYLLEQARLMTSKEITVLGHRAAIRPSTQFKRPLVGRHPEHLQHYIFNGLGTKGALQGPWAAQQLLAHMLHGVPLDPEIDCVRWWKG